METTKADIVIFWFRRDLRLTDNTALSEALKSGYPVLPVFIFDSSILDELTKDDARVTFIYKTLKSINKKINTFGGSVLCIKGEPHCVWTNLVSTYKIKRVYANKDYEPYAQTRDTAIQMLLNQHNIPFFIFKDHVIFEENEILKEDGMHYSVYTPYKNKWLDLFRTTNISSVKKMTCENFHKVQFDFPSIERIGFEISEIQVKPYTLEHQSTYHLDRDVPSVDKTSYLSPHLRFGTVSIREIITQSNNLIFLSELIWREFFIQILYHEPRVVNANYKQKYDGIEWRNNEVEFEAWSRGETGYPLVDAGMRQLNQTGYMHNRVRMITASFLCKHLLIDWRWGEAYFAKKLLDYELASNNGNWQWAAGTGCDAAPYFRIFSPDAQTKKFDQNGDYIKLWVSEWQTKHYPKPIVEHSFARNRALAVYKKGILSK